MTINVCLIHADARTFTFQADTWEKARAEAIRVSNDGFYTRSGANPIARIFMSDGSSGLRESTPTSLEIDQRMSQQRDAQRGR